jgi:ricin-type beta-trefoil lectin protein
MDKHVSAATPTGSALRRARLGSLRSRAAAATATVALATVGALAAGATSAHAASGFTIHLSPNSSFGLLLDMSGASTSSGGGLIQWYADGGANQNWNFIPVAGSENYLIQNGNSGLCLTTDGVAGDQIVQFPCAGGINQIWHTPVTPSLVGAGTIMNPWSGLYMDVYGDSPWAGAGIDAYYYNGGANQFFGAL